MKNLSTFQAVRVVVVVQLNVREGRGSRRGGARGSLLITLAALLLAKLGASVSFGEVALWCVEKSRAGIIGE